MKRKQNCTSHNAYQEHSTRGTAPANCTDTALHPSFTGAPPPLPETHAATQKHVFRKQCAHRTTFTIMDRSCSVIAPCRMRSVSSSSAALSPLPPTIAPLPGEVTHSEILESLMKPQQAQFKYINAAAKWSAHTRVHFLPFCFAGFFLSLSLALSLSALATPFWPY